MHIISLTVVYLKAEMNHGAEQNGDNWPDANL
jgi:hypothetical protein